MKRIFIIFLGALVFTSCGKNKAEKPIDINTEKVFINSATGSTWEYLLTHNDVPFDSPFYLENIGAETNFDNKTYKILSNLTPSGEYMPYYTHLFEDNKMLQPHLYDADPAIKIHTTIIDLTRQIQESWTNELAPGQRHILYIDSINLSLNGFDDVFKIVQENFFADQFVSVTHFYYNMEVGLIRRTTTENSTGSVFNTELVDWNVIYD